MSSGRWSACAMVANLLALGAGIRGFKRELGAAPDGVGVQACPAFRAAVLHRGCKRFLDAIGLSVRISGRPPSRGFLVINHLSYLDPVVLSSLYPFTFVSRTEIRGWPVFGEVMAQAGCVFINRRRHRDVRRIGSLLVAGERISVPVCLFAEATSTDGARILPFHSGLLQCALDCDLPVTAGFLRYSGPGAARAPYFGRMLFLPHLLRLFGGPPTTAEVCFAARPCGARTDRKTLARALHRQVLDLARTLPAA